jgi:enoyl-CoA hydratase
MSGEMISADRAYEIGLVNRVVPQTDLQNEGLQMMKTFLSKGLKAISFLLAVVHEGLNSKLEDGIESEAMYFGKACATEDMVEGTTAFLEKRKPEFKGI